MATEPAGLCGDPHALDLGVAVYGIGQDGVGIIQAG
jgi:hypothetical protein